MTASRSGFLLIADITGYTAFLSQSELEHARDSLNSLLGLLVEQKQRLLRISRLEGDAVFSYVSDTVGESSESRSAGIKSIIEQQKWRKQMSLNPRPIFEVPEETARVAHAAFPKGNIYLRIRDRLGVFYEDEQFAPLFSERGQPAFSPWRLALISIMQFVEDLSDRQAAEAVRGRIDWKYLLGLELEDAGFDYSVLSEFRQRLLDGGLEQELLDTNVACFG